MNKAVPEFELADTRYTYEELMEVYNNGVRDGRDLTPFQRSPKKKEYDNTQTLHYEFKPCPDCNDKPEVDYKKNNIGELTIAVYCDCCCMYTSEFGSEDLAKELQSLSDRWNRRV